jgi:threonyl-tRNA synthetase
MNRIWQCGTIQLDMFLPERFDITYIDKDGKRRRPTMLHRAIFGSLERFIGILIEHYGGAFPLWLAPVQVKLIPVNNEYHLEFVNKLHEKFMKAGIRVEIDDRDEKLGYKIREAQTKKIPYQLVIGDKEVSENILTIRKYGSKDTFVMSIDEFINFTCEQVKNLRS